MKNILRSATLMRQTQRGFATKVALPNLPYSLNGLEPVLSGKLMDFHYNKHHKAYVDNFNAKSAELEEAMAKGDASKITTLT